MLISKHFTLEQLTVTSLLPNKRISNTPSKSSVENLSRLAKGILDPVHEKFGKELVIYSGFRSPQYNERSGGLFNSQHCVGEAVDFRVIDVPNLKVARFITDRLLYDQCVMETYSTLDDTQAWLHVSLRSFGNRREQLVSFKNGSKTKYFKLEERL